MHDTWLQPTCWFYCSSGAGFDCQNGYGYDHRPYRWTAAIMAAAYTGESRGVSWSAWPRRTAWKCGGHCYGPAYIYLSLPISLLWA